MPKTNGTVLETRSPPCLGSRHCCGQRRGFTSQHHLYGRFLMDRRSFMKKAGTAGAGAVAAAGTLAAPA
ncbi:twin-arginine translocation signal domain-containing protein, partial [Rhizobium sp. CF122]|uniref:twin-arginine translocation signal domain-containing protein n=1 Tax=Rhizobium sp. CF122 TaxID=1144312 RepID=UPI003FD27510